MKALKLIDKMLERFAKQDNIIIGKDELEEIRKAMITDEIPEGMCKIYSTRENFDEMIIDAHLMVSTCKEIWNKPNIYSGHKPGSASSYTELLQFIRIECWNGEKYTLMDVIREAR